MSAPRMTNDEATGAELRELIRWEIESELENTGTL